MAHTAIRLGYISISGGGGGGGGIVEFANLAAFPAIGQSNLVYLALDTKKIYKWSSGTYLLISPSEVTSVNTEVGAVVLDKADIGLGNVDNTSDANKPISSATQTALNAKVETTLVGAINGVASLDGTGKVPSTQLPSYVDDVLEFANLAAFPVTGATGIIYVALDTNKCYRWSGSAYVEISPSEVNSVAGKTGIVTLVKADVGLSNVDNTSDANKPISTATQTALNAKIESSLIGVANGIASLDATARIPLSQTPSGTTGRILIGNTSGSPSFSATPVLGEVGTAGTIGLSGSTSGVITIRTQAVAGTANFNLPITSGTAGQALISGGTTNAQTWQTVSASSTASSIVSRDSNGVAYSKSLVPDNALVISSTSLSSFSAEIQIVYSATTMTLPNVGTFWQGRKFVFFNKQASTSLTIAAFGGTTLLTMAPLTYAEVTCTDVSAGTQVDGWDYQYFAIDNSLPVSSLTGDVTATGGTGSSTATISNLAVTNAKIANSTIDLTTKVTGVLPIANGGTNSSTALNNNRIMLSSAGSIIESAAITASRALVSDASGIPIASATTSTELGYVSGVTSAIQTQFSGKQDTITGAATTITSANLTVSRAVVSDATGKIVVSTVTSTEVGYLSGVTSAIQTQINSKQNSLGFTPEDVANKSTTTTLGTSNTLYPTQNAVKTYVDNAVTSGATPDATTLVKGKILLAGDLSGTADLPTVPGLATKEPTITATTAADYYRGDKTFQPLNKSAVGLSNVDNTSDANKPISSATQTALNAKYDASNPSNYVNAAGAAAAAPVQSVAGKTGIVTLDKTDVGLSNVDNTSDLNKPISTATQTALNGKENTITAGTASQYYRGDKTFQTLDKTAVGLANVDNTSDANKPISTATQTALNAKVDNTLVGAINGVASLDGTGKVPSTQLPSYVDDVLEFANLAAFPVTGETGKIYVTLDTNLTYRWSGSIYVEISVSLALGETSSTAYRGDRGKTAYDHSQIVAGNPHGTTKSDVGLSNVDNTSDLNKPISTATQTALNGKANTAHVHALSDLTQSAATSGQVPSWNGTNWVPVTPSAGVTDHTLLTNIGTNTHAQIDTFMATTSNVYLETKEPTGFFSRTTSTLSFDNGTRNFSITPTGASFEFWVKGVKYTKTGAQTIQIPALSGNHFIYFDPTGALATTQAAGPELFIDNALISIIYWNTDTNTRTYFAEERHGMQMDGATHSYLHTVFGAQFISGLALQGFSVDGTGNVNSDAQFTSDSGTIRDEDIVITISAQTQIPVLYRQGLLWRKKTADAYPVIYSGTAGYTGASGRLPYNQFTGGAWQLTEVPSLDFVLVHLFATNDIENPIVAIQGIASYPTTPAARLAASSEITSLSGLPFAEFVALGSVIFQTSTGYANATKSRIRSTDTGGDYVDFRGTQLYTPAGEVTTHGLLSGLSSDDHLQYHTDARGDIRYYTKAQVDTIIAGITSPGDLDDTAFSLANNQSSPANVTGFAFANATVRSFEAIVSVFIDATTDFYEQFKIKGIQKGSEWDFTVSSQGDVSGVTFSITNAGQVQYTSTNNAGFTSGVIRFRALTTAL
jgi:hypothetical protein